MVLLSLCVQPTGKRYLQSHISVCRVPPPAGGGGGHGSVQDGVSPPSSSAASRFQPLLFLFPQAAELSSESALSTEGMLLTSTWLSKTILSEFVPLPVFPSLSFFCGCLQKWMGRGSCELLLRLSGHAWCEEVETPVPLCSLCAGSSPSLKYFPVGSQTGLPSPKLGTFPNFFPSFHMLLGKGLLLRDWDAAPAAGG